MPPSVSTAFRTIKAQLDAAWRWLVGIKFIQKFMDKVKELVKRQPPSAEAAEPLKKEAAAAAAASPTFMAEFKQFFGLRMVRVLSVSLGAILIFYAIYDFLEHRKTKSVQLIQPSEDE
jgi:hypothetical protein